MAKKNKSKEKSKEKSKKKSKEKTKSKDKGGKKKEKKKKGKAKEKAKDKEAVEEEGLDWTALSQGQQEEAAKAVERKRKRPNDAVPLPVEDPSEVQSQGERSDEKMPDMQDSDEHDSDSEEDEEDEEEEEETPAEPPAKKKKKIGTVGAGTGIKQVSMHGLPKHPSVGPRPTYGGKMPKPSMFPPGEKPTRATFQGVPTPSAFDDKKKSSESSDSSDYSYSSSKVVNTKGLNILAGFWSLVPVRGVGVRDVVLQCVFSACFLCVNVCLCVQRRCQCPFEGEVDEETRSSQIEFHIDFTLERALDHIFVYFPAFSHVIASSRPVKAHISCRRLMARSGSRSSTLRRMYSTRVPSMSSTSTLFMFPSPPHPARSTSRAARTANRNGTECVCGAHT
jgi:hypothetical protein